MGLETGTYILDLVSTNPPGSDLFAQGDDHLRLIKAVLRSTFPNANKAFYFPDTAAKSANFSVLSTDLNKTFLVTTTGGSVTATLPSLVSGDAGWFCYFFKATADTNPIFIAPPSGTIQSGDLTGLAKTRRCIPGVAVRAWWTGSAFIVERAEKAPVGAVIDFDGSSLPVGYELPNGQTLSGTAGSVYPDYYARKGALTTRDISGRVVAMKESVATRLTTANCGIDGSTLGAAGGEDSHVLVSAETPVETHTFTGTQETWPLNQSDIIESTGVRVTSGASSFSGNPGTPTVTVTPHGTINSHGGGQGHTNTQPTIVLNKILVVE